MIHYKNVVIKRLQKMSVVRDKRAKFVELAESRVSRAIKTIRLIGNLSNRNNYEYGQADIVKIFSALDGELRNLRVKFKMDVEKNKPEFKL